MCDIIQSIILYGYFFCYFWIFLPKITCYDIIKWITFMHVFLNPISFSFFIFPVICLIKAKSTLDLLSLTLTCFPLTPFSEETWFHSFRKAILINCTEQHSNCVISLLTFSASLPFPLYYKVTSHLFLSLTWKSSIIDVN